MSSTPGGRRPHVRAGTLRTSRRSRATASASCVTTTGGPTACCLSEMVPCAQQRTSYRNQRDRPRIRKPTGPLATTPRSIDAPPHAGVISTMYGTPARCSSSAAWKSGRGRRRPASAHARSHHELVCLTKRPPAPTGSQRSSARSWLEGVLDAVTRQRYGKHVDAPGTCACHTRWCSRS
jgi:hypothetical protein